MTARSPWGLYAAVFATGGLFGWVWLVKLMSDVNEMEGRRVFPTKVLSVVFAGVLIGYFALVALIPHRETDIPGLSYDPSLVIFFAIVVTLSPAFFLVLVSRHIDAAAGRKSSIVGDLKVFFLTLFMFIGFPMVQQYVNDLVRTRTERGRTV